MRQVIIARKDLNMSPGKLAAQVAHASWAFLSKQIRKANINEQDIQNTWIEVINKLHKKNIPVVVSYAKDEYLDRSLYRY